MSARQLVLSTLIVIAGCSGASPEAQPTELRAARLGTSEVRQAPSTPPTGEPLESNDVATKPNWSIAHAARIGSRWTVSKTEP